MVEERFARHGAESRDALRSDMRTGFDALRSEMHAGFDALRSEMHTGLDTLRGEMHTGLDTLRSEMHAGFLDVQKQLLDQQQQLTGMAKEIGSVRADLRKEITVQTRWLLTVLVAATVLIPVMQRVLGAVFP